MSVAMPWHEAVSRARRIVLIVNSPSNAGGELAHVLDALGRTTSFDRVAAIAPAAARGDLVRRGISARAILPYEVEVGFFLQGDRALQWAIRQNADLFLGSEPYAPNNEEVKEQFELRVAPMLGAATLLAHSLPSDAALVLAADDLWRRAARREAVDAHRARVGLTLEQLHQLWASDPHAPVARANAIAAQHMAPPDPSTRPLPASVVEACRWSCDRLHAVIRTDGGYGPSPVRIIVDPAGEAPLGGWIGTLETVRRPAQLSSGVRQHRAGLSFRGTAAEPYGYWLMSRFVDLEPGDAAIAEGGVHHGGVTVGLVKDEQWAARIDIVDRGRFLAAAVATAPGRHALVVAHCLHGADRRSAVAIRRFGIRRAGN